MYCELDHPTHNAVKKDFLPMQLKIILLASALEVPKDELGQCVERRPSFLRY